MKAKAPAIALVALLGVIAAALWPMLLMLHHTWIDKYGALSHGYLVLALCVWFAVRAWRAPPRPAATHPVWSAAPVLAALLGIAALAQVLYVGPTITVLVPPILLASIALCMGSVVAMRMAWPVLFLFFANPIWGVFNGPLQNLTTRVAQPLVALLGVPVFVEGNFVHLPSGTFEIASGCSGLNYFVASLTLAAVYSTLFLTTWRSRVSLMIAAAFAGLLANWLRVTSLIVIGHVTKMQHYLIRVDHLYYGWALFLLTMVPVFLLARRLENREQLSAGPAPVALVVPPAMARWAARVVWVAAAMTILAAALLVLHERLRRDVVRTTPAAQGISDSVVQERFVSGWQPTFKGATERRLEWTRGAPIEIYTASFAHQSRDARLSYADNSITGHAFQVLESRVIDAPDLVPGASIVEVTGVLAGRERLLWNWYDVAGRTAWSKRTLRTAELLGLISGRRDAKVTALLTDCQGDCDLARGRLRAFLSQR